MTALKQALLAAEDIAKRDVVGIRWLAMIRDLRKKVEESEEDTKPAAQNVPFGSWLFCRHSKESSPGLCYCNPNCACKESMCKRTSV